MNTKVLKQQKQTVIDNVLQIYKKEIDKLWSKIQEINLSTNLADPKLYIYEVPNFILGQPQYDPVILNELVKKRLKRGKFCHKPFKSNGTFYILIDWSNL